MLPWKRFLLKRRLRSPDAAARLAALKAIPSRSLYDERILKLLVSALRDIDADVSSAARAALVEECTGPRGSSRVRTLTSLRAAAARAERQQLDAVLHGVASALVTGLKYLPRTSLHAADRSDHAETLAEMGDARAVPYLIEVLQDAESHDHYRRWKAMAALGTLGPAAKDALPVLNELAHKVYPPHDIQSLWAPTTAQHALAAIARIENALRVERGVASPVSCPGCQTAYDRQEVIRQILRQSPEMSDFAIATTRFRCVSCGRDVSITLSRDEVRA